MRLCFVCLPIFASVIVAGCASNQCDFHSQCGTRRYCELGRCLQQCRMDFDCDPGQRCNEIGQCVARGDGEVPIDAYVPPPADGGPRDAFVPPPFDAGRRDAFVPPIDAGPRDAFVPPPLDSGPPPPTGRYLDRCTGPGDCISGLCTDDVGGTRMCTMSCSSHIDCASEHVCAGGVCVRDDTGRPCSAASACALGLCVGNSMTGGGQCTRPCSSAAECPAGFACADAGGARVCVDIERPCTGASQCATGLCLSAQGCTAACRTAADCPATLSPLVSPYTCRIAFGSTTPICVPPPEVVGADPIGASCRLSPIGDYYCRSFVCDESAPLGPMCTQSCNEEGGCGPGLACYPLVDGGSIFLVCERAGSLPLGSACGGSSQCDSGLCDMTGSYCTRLCTNDGLCPSGMRCEPVAGFGIAICRR